MGETTGISWCDATFNIIGRDGDREEVLEKYDRHIGSQHEMLEALGELRGKTLGCWCHPEACHGDVPIEWLKVYG